MRRGGQAALEDGNPAASWNRPEPPGPDVRRGEKRLRVLSSRRRPRRL